MQISWNGLGSFTMTSKPAQAEVTLVTNPFTSTEVKFKPLEASIVVQSHAGKDTNNLSAISPEHPEEGRKTFVVMHAGEFEIQGVFVTGVHAPKKDGTPHTIYRFDAEGMRVAWLGALDRALSAADIEALGPIDILILPAGGQDVLSATQAAEVVAQIEPRLVIASYVGSSGYGTVDALKRELGCQSEEMPKLKIVRAGLPEEDMKMILLSQ
ncbi:MAG TPA: MBL fold metallo-hydrolase [bacterium]|nr:MBL fold metallo-hydrolase [bacterium]